jgi:phosphonate transport system substrate-binding protein
MLNRRHLLAAPALLPALLVATRAVAQPDWRAQFRELRLGISSAENERDAVARHQPFALYMERTLGVPLRIFRATDYAGVVEAMRNKHVEIARMGPAAYALAHRVMGQGIEPVARVIDLEGQQGYHAVIVVRADSAFRTLEDLRGRSLAWPDPNSASGFAVPQFYLRRQGVVPEQFFARTGFSGSHEQGVMAVLNNSFDAATTFWSSERVGNVQRMTDKGMIQPNVTRIVWTSPEIPNSPITLRTDLPAAMRADIVRVLFAMQAADPEAFAAFTSNQASGIAAVTHEAYRDMIAITEENAARRRQRG